MFARKRPELNRDKTNSVVDLYRDRGCYLLAERWRCAHGEIDLIFRNPQTGGLIFTEVKKSRSIAAAAVRGRSAARTTD